MGIKKLAQFENGYKEYKEDVFETLEVFECINLNIVNDQEAFVDFLEMMRNILVDLDTLPEIDVEDLKNRFDFKGMREYGKYR